MRILYITTGFPYPLTSGLLRHYFLIRELSRRHSVTLLSVVKPDFAPEHLEGLRPFTRGVRTFPRENPPRSLPHRAARQFLSGADDPAVHRLGAHAARLHREEPFDAVVHSGKLTRGALEQLHGVPVVADVCDSAWVRFRSLIPRLGPRRWPVALAYYLHASWVERHFLRHAAHVLFAAARDRNAAGRIAKENGAVVPNGVDADYWRRLSPDRGTNTILFTGAMHYRPNVDAARYLIDQLLPLVRKSVPEARLLIVGRDPTPELVAAGVRPGVTVTGFVEDMRPYLEQATVFAAPLRFGAGIQNKVLEAMAMEVPVVASPGVAEGLRTEDGEEPPIVVTRGTNAFAKELVRQLERARSCAAPDAGARSYVERHFRWQASGEKLERVLDRVTGGLPALRPGRTHLRSAMTIEALPFGALTPDQLRSWSEIQSQRSDTDSPFLSPGFTRAVAAVRDDVEVAVMNLRGRTVGFLPFHRSRSNVARPIGMRLCDLQGAVVEEGVEWDAGQVVRGAGLSALHYENLLVSQGQMSRFHWGVAPSPFIDLNGGFEKYRAQRRGAGSEQLLQVLRKTRKLEREMGPIRFDWHTTDRSIFETLLRWKSEKRRSTHTFNVLELDWVVRLLDQLRASESEDARGVLSAMFVGDRLAAAHLGLRNRSTMHFWFSAFDRELGKHSPGLVMILSMIRACEHRGVTCIHLGKGLEQFKLGLMTDSLPVVTGAVARSGMSWAAGSAWYRTRQWLRTSSLRGALLIPRRAIRKRQHQSAMR